VRAGRKRFGIESELVSDWFQDTLTGMNETENHYYFFYLLCIFIPLKVLYFARPDTPTLRMRV
jgi:hypothetical protein